MRISNQDRNKVNKHSEVETMGETVKETKQKKNWWSGRKR